MATASSDQRKPRRFIPKVSYKDTSVSAAASHRNNRPPAPIDDTPAIINGVKERPTPPATPRRHIARPAIVKRHTAAPIDEAAIHAAITGNQQPTGNMNIINNAVPLKTPTTGNQAMTDNTSVAGNAALSNTRMNAAIMAFGGGPSIVDLRPDYDSMTEEQRDSAKQGLIFDIENSLIPSSPSLKAKSTAILESLPRWHVSLVHDWYDKFFMHWYAEREAVKYRQYLYIIWKLMEVCIGKFLGISMEGFANYQADLISQYDETLMKLGQQKYLAMRQGPGGISGGWSPETTIIVNTCLFAGIFVVAKIFTQGRADISGRVVNDVLRMLSGGSGSSTRPSSTATPDGGPIDGIAALLGGNFDLGTMMGLVSSFMGSGNNTAGASGSNNAIPSIAASGVPPTTSPQRTAVPSAAAAFQE